MNVPQTRDPAAAPEPLSSSTVEDQAIQIPVGPGPHVDGAPLHPLILLEREVAVLDVMERAIIGEAYA